MDFETKKFVVFLVSLTILSGHHLLSATLVQPKQVNRAGSEAAPKGSGGLIEHSHPEPIQPQAIISSPLLHGRVEWTVGTGTTITPPSGALAIRKRDKSRELMVEESLDLWTTQRLLDCFLSFFISAVLTFAVVMLLYRCMCKKVGAEIAERMKLRLLGRTEGAIYFDAPPRTNRDRQTMKTEL